TEVSPHGFFSPRREKKLFFPARMRSRRLRQGGGDISAKEGDDRSGSSRESGIGSSTSPSSSLSSSPSSSSTDTVRATMVKIDRYISISGGNKVEIAPIDGTTQ
ncbi:hypothetical protein BHE74_00050630, partial [Ensete ventricosum]